MTPKLRIAAITDEFSPDLETALDAMQPIGMTGVELLKCLLPSATSIEIEWPSGAKQGLANVAADQYLTIQEPAQ